MSYKYSLFSFDGIELGHTLAPNDVDALFQIQVDRGQGQFLEICADQGDTSARFYLEKTPPGNFASPEKPIWVCPKGDQPVASP
jgi:hypothetical protein